MPRSSITRTALGSTGLGWLPALTRAHRAARQALAQRLRDLRTRAVAGAKKQHVRYALGGAYGRLTPVRDATTRRRSAAARRSALGRGRNTCHARRRNCAAWKPGRPRVVCAGGTRPRAGARPASSHSSPTRRSLRASSLSSRQRNGCPASRRNRGGPLSPCAAIAPTRRMIHQFKLMGLAGRASRPDRRSGR